MILDSESASILQPLASEFPASIPASTSLNELLDSVYCLIVLIAIATAIDTYLSLPTATANCGVEEVGTAYCLLPTDYRGTVGEGIAIAIAIAVVVVNLQSQI